MASSSSSSSGQPTQPVWLYQSTTVTSSTRGPAIARVALVEAPIPLPPLISYLGNNYVWSTIYWCYLYAAPANVAASGRTEIISVLANPQF